MTAIARPILPTLPIGGRSIAAGVAAAAALLGVYLAIIGLAQGVEHAFAQLAADALFVGLIAAGFGTQVALFVELRAVDRRHRAAAAVTAAGTGTSAAAMLACCAHHLVDLLPLVGLSAAAVFLNAYKTPLFVVGISMSVIGIVVIARQLQRARRACPVADGAMASGGAGASHNHPSDAMAA
ncbi:MAG TPA: hypothetical protein VJZ72_01750 [Candidatus Limnocylindrales bacterium]|nr:hypothetical protein [Candidatus Limnocylindrales bacterium]